MQYSGISLQWFWDQCERLTSVTLIVALIPDPLWVSELQQAYDLQWIWDQMLLLWAFRPL